MILFDVAVDIWEVIVNDAVINKIAVEENS